MNIDLTGKTALVTGSTVGIGRATAKGLAQSGAAVLVNGRTPGKVDATVAALKSEVPGADIRAAAGDVSTADGCAAVGRAAPSVDILVNNAGIYEAKSFAEIPDAEWTRFSRSMSCPGCGFRAPTCPAC
jgi:NAD(P)-dependent dehydrogenase (short-subunit alcohol dehydrogenase family)